MKDSIRSDTELRRRLKEHSRQRQESIASEIRKRGRRPAERPRESRTPPQEPEMLETPERTRRRGMPKKPEGTADKLTKYIYLLEMENWCRALCGRTAIQYGQYTLLSEKEKIFREGTEEHWKKLEQELEEKNR